MEANSLTDEEMFELMKNRDFGLQICVPNKEEYYTFSDLDEIRKYNNTFKWVEEIFGKDYERAARALSEDKNATASWFDETIPEASDITNLMMSEFVCKNACLAYEEYMDFLHKKVTQTLVQSD